jgi:transcriptional regulator with XRE-family HTH domain
MILLGERLTILRKNKGLTQEACAKKIGIPRSTYSNYENGKREPDIETIRKMASFFEVSTDFLLGYTNIPQTKKASEMTEVEIEEFIHNPKIRPKYKGRELTKEEIEKVSKMLEVILERMDNDHKK